MSGGGGPRQCVLGYLSEKCGFKVNEGKHKEKRRGFENGPEGTYRQMKVSRGPMERHQLGNLSTDAWTPRSSRVTTMLHDIRVLQESR